MSTKTHEFTNQGWDEYAEIYDTLCQLRPYTKLLQRLVGGLNPNNEDSILDAGCGTANLLSALRAQVKNAQLRGIDTSDVMLKHANKKYPRLALKLSKANLDTTLPFGDETFTKLACSNALYAVEDPAHTLLELHRILKKGGSLVLTTPKKGYENGLILKAHAQSPKPDSYWEGAHSSPERESLLIREAIDDIPLQEAMLKVAAYNREIVNTSKFHFFTSCGLQQLVLNAGFTITTTDTCYADQSLFIIAQKEK